MTTVVFSVASGFARAGVGMSAVGPIDELARRTRFTRQRMRSRYAFIGI